MSRLSVLLTGPGGRIGPHLLPSFRERYDLRVLDRHPIEGFPDTIITDLSEPGVLRTAMTGVDVVVHLAATSDEAPFHEALVPPNIVGVYNVLEAAREVGVRRVVFASTVQTVGFSPRDHTILITERPRPVSVYGATKVWGETLGSWYHDRHGLEFVGVRIAAFQPYDSEHLRRSKGLRDIWLSPRDCTEILHRCIERPGLGYALLFATSLTEFERLSRAPMKELLDYVPQDNVADIPFEASADRAAP
jgi:nucleoside-diphosphate-sugar epimerase